MMRQIDKLNAVCGVLKTFAKGHDGSLDESSAKGLDELSGRIAELVTQTITTSDDVAVARSDKSVAFDNCQRALLECKKNIEIVAVRDRKNVVLPLISGQIPSPRRIITLANDYLQAAATAGDDPALVKSAEALKTALDAYIAASGYRTKRVFGRRAFRAGMATELSGLAARVSGYTAIIAYNVTEDDRRQLFMRIKNTVPRKKPQASVVTPVVPHPQPQPIAAPPAPIVQPTVTPVVVPPLPKPVTDQPVVTPPVVVTPVMPEPRPQSVASDGNKVLPSVQRDTAVTQSATPALPAVPATAVPPSNEFPAISATA